MVEIEVFNGDIETAIRRLKKIVAKDGSLQSLRWRLNDGAKPSVRKKKKAMRARKRLNQMKRRKAQYAG